MINIKFYKPEELDVQHGMSLICLIETSSFDRVGFNPRELIVEWVWDEYDVQGDLTGVSSTYDIENDKEYKLGDTVQLKDNYYVKLNWLAGSYNSSDVAYCTTPDEYFRSYET